MRQTYRGPLRAAILDWAGTTVDFGCHAPVAVLMEVFHSYGVPIEVAEARRSMGLPKKEHVRSILAQPRVAGAWAAAQGAPPVDPDVDRLYAAFAVRQIECVAAYSDVIPGVPQVVGEMRTRGMQIGSTTGYTRAMLDAILPRAAAAGYRPDCSVTPEEAGAGRPAPWMCFRNMQQLGVFPPAACVKIGDTAADIREGIHAGMWTVGVIDSGNEVGLSLAEWSQFGEYEKAAVRQRAREVLMGAGADFAVETLSDLPPVLDEIERWLRSGCGVRESLNRQPGAQ